MKELIEKIYKKLGIEYKSSKNPLIVQRYGLPAYIIGDNGMSKNIEYYPFG